jgi:putative acetyltransferase
MAIAASIRTEAAGDFDAIDDVVAQAFGSPLEAQLVGNIRASTEYVPELALVAVRDDEIIGHVMVSHCALEDETERYEIATLSPVSVRPDHQGGGVGSAIIREVIARADARHEPLIVVEGSPLYYPRFGFRAAAEFGVAIHLPDWAPPEAAMVLPLDAYRADLRGKVAYSSAFDDVTPD